MSLAPQACHIDAQLARVSVGPVALHLFEQLESTSVWLREQFSKKNHDVDSAISHLCATNWQTAGIARRGKTWQTKPGNLTFSLLSTTDKVATELLGLSLVTGIGVANCLQEALDVRVQLKWPNDVLIGGAKLGGLLTEIISLSGKPRQEQTGGCHILSGIGINFLDDPDVQNLGIGATSLEKQGLLPTPLQRDELIGKLAASVLSEHQRFYKHGWSVFADRWKTLDWLLNKNVMIHSQNAAEQALARGVNQQGALLVERDGVVFPVYSGEVSVRPVL